MQSRERAPLSRDAVLLAALRLADAEGLDALSMRKLAAELGVQAMSLYNHVACKNAILDGIASLLLSEVEIPEAFGQPWGATARATARSYRQVALAHPRTSQLMLTRNMQGAALLLARRALGDLVETGLDPTTSVHVMRTFVAFLSGSVLRELQLSEASDGDSPDRREEELRRSPHPEIAAAAGALARFDHEAEFDFGVELLIGAVEALVEQRGGATRRGGPGGR